MIFTFIVELLFYIQTDSLQTLLFVFQQSKQHYLRLKRNMFVVQPFLYIQTLNDEYVTFGKASQMKSFESDYNGRLLVYFPAVQTK